MDKRFWGILIAIVVILGGIFLATNHNNNSSSSGNGKPTNHVEGQGKANVKLVEYGDYECPFCGQYYPVVKQVVSTYSPDIYFQFRNLPLTQIHPNAYVGARAAEAAALQNQFWQMHDLLYENQNQWSTSSDPETYFIQYAKQLGLNVTKFKNDMSSDQVNNSIQADINAFLNTPYVNHDTNKEATPTFFLDGQNINPGVFNADQTINAQATLANFQNDLNAAIKKKGFSPPTSASSTPGTSTSNSNGTGQSKQ